MTDELSRILAGAWARLHHSAEIRDEGFRMVQLATVGLAGQPQLRTVVLRGADLQTRTLRVHTDARSPKIAELRADPRLSLVAYHQEAGEQIRIEGVAALHMNDDTARDAWDQSQPQSRLCYGAPMAPSDPVEDPTDADLTTAAMADPAGGFANFCAVLIRVERLDWLDLAASGHRRARFDWQADAPRAVWLAP